MASLIIFLINPVRYYYTKNFLITLWDINLKVNKFWFAMNNDTHSTNKLDNETNIKNNTEIVQVESNASFNANTTLMNLFENILKNPFDANNTDFNPYKNLVDGFQNKLNPNETFKIWCFVFFLMHLFGILTVVCHMFTGLILYQGIIVSYVTLAIYNWTLMKIPWHLFEIIVFAYLILNLFTIIFKDLFQNYCLECNCCRTNNEVHVDKKFLALSSQPALMEHNPLLLYNYPNNFNL